MTDQQGPESSSITESLKKLAICQYSSFLPSTPSDEQDQSENKTNSSFFMQLRPASKLKHALSALSDSDFNEHGTAMIEVDDEEFTVTVRNPQNNDLGFLRFYPDGFKAFELRKPLRRKMINLNRILEYLTMAHDQDTVTIYHVDESTKLSFKFGTKTIINFTVDLDETDEEFKRCPDVINYACDCIILKENLLKFLPYVEESEAKLVSFGISNIMLNLSVGAKGITLDFDDPKTEGIRGMAPQQFHHVFFEWPYYKSLKKASYLAKCVLLCIVTDPEESIMWRFNLKELGDLVFIKRARIFMLNVNTDSDEFDPPRTEDDGYAPTGSFEVIMPLSNNVKPDYFELNLAGTEDDDNYPTAPFEITVPVGKLGRKPR